MSKELEEEKEIVITLLSNGSPELFKNNSLTFFSNRLHTPIILNPSNYNYIAIQEVGISLKSSNIKISNDNPTLIYFEWDISTFLYFYPDFSADLTNIEILKKTFLNTYKKNKEHFFINYPNNFGIYSNKIFIDNQIYTPKTIEEELKRSTIFSNGEGKINIDLANIYIEKLFNDKKNIPTLLQQFVLKRSKNNVNSNNSLEYFTSSNKVIGVLVHKNLAKALKIDTYFKKELKDNSERFEIPNTIDINSETYSLYFLNEGEEIKGRIIYDNTITSYDNDVINIDCNLTYPYISNEKFCTTIATFNNVSDSKKFLYYYPDNRAYYKLRGNEIQDISIHISDKEYNQLNLFKGIPTILKLVIKSQPVMDFTSNLRVSSKVQIISNFYNKNSFFRVILPQNDIFQSETSQLSISSITYPNRFKVLPEYLKARYITTFFMYSNQNIILSEMQINSPEKNGFIKRY